MKHLDWFIRLTKTAGAKKESNTERDGFLSYHAETHALAMGLAAAYAAVAFNETSLLSAVYAAAAHGRVAQSQKKRRRIFRDIVQEPHYALFGVVVGGTLGAGVRVALGDPPLPNVGDIVTALG